MLRHLRLDFTGTSKQGAQKQAARRRTAPLSRRSQVLVERLEPRLALASGTVILPLNTFSGLPVTSYLGDIDGIDLQVRTTGAFQSNGSLLFGPAGKTIFSSFAAVSYGSATGTGDVWRFDTLAVTGGDADKLVNANTVIRQAAQTQTSQTGTFSASKLTVAASGVGKPRFRGTGYVIIPGSGGQGIFSYRTSGSNASTLPTATKSGTLRGLSLVGVVGVTQAAAAVSTFAIGLGAPVIETTAPAPRQTVATQATTLSTNPFTLPVVATQFGFPVATAAAKQYLNLSWTDDVGQRYALVSYTGQTATSFTGCVLEQLDGQAAAVSDIASFPMNAAVGVSANGPITFTVTNNAANQGLATYIALAGQSIDLDGKATNVYLTPVLNAQGTPNFSQPLQVVSAATSPPAYVPSFVLFAAGAKATTRTFLVNNVPAARLDSVRAIVSMGLPPSIPLDGSGAAQFPDSSNPTDANDTINYDFFEFTQRHQSRTNPGASGNDGTLFIDTTQVDAVGLPMTLQIGPRDGAGRDNGVGTRLARGDWQPQFLQYLGSQMAAATAKTSPVSAAATAAETAFKNLVTPYRLSSPKDAILNPPASMAAGDKAALEGYFDAALATFFGRYTGGGFLLERDGAYWVGTTQTQFTPASYPGGAGTLTANSSSTSGTLALAAGPPAGVIQPGMLVKGSGISSTAAVVTAVSGATVTLAGTFTGSSSGSYEFDYPGVYTVLQLQQADPSWELMHGGQTYHMYAPFFAENRPLRDLPAGLPNGGGIGSVRIANAGTGFTPNASGTLTFSGGGGGGASGIFFTNAAGQIAAVALTRAGSGYSGPLTVGFTGIATVGTATVEAHFAPQAPSWAGGPQAQSAGQMVFACDGVFTDGGAQQLAGQIRAPANPGTLEDIENTIVSAFNRGVANLVPVDQPVSGGWKTVTNFYPEADTTGSNWSNPYAGFLHKPAISLPKVGSNVGLAYAFAYDDQGGFDPTLANPLVNSVSLALNPWTTSDKRGTAAPLAFTTQPTWSVTTQLLSFQLQGLPSGTFPANSYSSQLVQVSQTGPVLSAPWTNVGAPAGTTVDARGNVRASITKQYQLTPGITYVVVVSSNEKGLALGGQYAVSRPFTVPPASSAARLGDRGFMAAAFALESSDTWRRMPGILPMAAVKAHSASVRGGFGASSGSVGTVQIVYRPTATSPSTT